MSLVRTRGIIIKVVNTGEADRIVTILSDTNGKVQAMAKGARRPKNKLMAGTHFLCYSDFVLFKGRTLYSINSCECIENFYDLRNDIVKLTYASYMSRLLYDTVQEEQPSQSILSLFLNSLYVLVKADSNSNLIARAFELRLLSELGFAPAADVCGICGSSLEENCSFSFDKCSVLCERCSRPEIGDVPIKTGTLKAARHILYSKPEDIFKFRLAPSILEELGRLNDRYLKATLDKDYRQLDFLKTLGS
jgi:DNA repair protein RecO (recombination protein O)